MFTAIQLYYLSLTSDDRARFKKKVLEDTGISNSTFTRSLTHEPGKLLKQYLANESNIAACNLYKIVDPITNLKNSKNHENAV